MVLFFAERRQHLGQLRFFGGRPLIEEVAIRQLHLHALACLHWKQEVARGSAAPPLDLQVLRLRATTKNDSSSLRVGATKTGLMFRRLIGNLISCDFTGR